MRLIHRQAGLLVVPGREERIVICCELGGLKMLGVLAYRTRSIQLHQALEETPLVSVRSES